ncbi:hypothetical protein QLX08_010608 [Tetragonisca angustula]|uniref:Uncharacterized protein n=1 Tax=Tetragonisca angustula TaxID=166442 RepID=A0AAW0ZB96_9HYME
MMYSPDKMMGSKGLHGAPITAPGCFPSGRYSPPPYRAAPDPMPPPPRRCMPNPTSRILEDASIMCNSWSPRHNVSTITLLPFTSITLIKSCSSYDHNEKRIILKNIS